MFGYVKVGAAVPKLRVADCVFKKKKKKSRLPRRTSVLRKIHCNLG